MNNSDIHSKAPYDESTTLDTVSSELSYAHRLAGQHETIVLSGMMIIMTHMLFHK